MTDSVISNAGKRLPAKAKNLPVLRKRLCVLYHDALQQ
jgi:hypothetical protein